MATKHEETGHHERKGHERNEPETTGARLRAARERSGRTLRALAQDLGVSPATLSQIENDRTRLSVGRLSRAADALGTTVADILAGPPDNRPDVPAPREVARTSPARPAAPPRHWRDYPPLELDPVLGAALREFVQSGYHGTSVRDIARRCGLSVSGLYHYYNSKQDMLATLLRGTMEELLWRSESARDEGGTPTSRFCRLIEHLALFHTYRRELGFIGAAEMRSLHPDNRDEIAGMRHAQQRLVDAEVASAVDDGDFRTPHPREAARAVVTMCTALPTWFSPGGPLSPEQIARQYVDFALDVMRDRSEP